MTRHGTRHVLTRWLSLFTMFKAVTVEACCLAASWIFISEQGDEMASDEQPTIQELWAYEGLGGVVRLMLPMARADRDSRPVYYLPCSDLGQVVNLSLSVA